MIQWACMRGLAVVGLTFALLIVACGGERAERGMSGAENARLVTLERAVTSPTGKHRLELVKHAAGDDEAAYVTIRIRDRADRVVYDSRKRFSRRFATEVLWDDSVDRAWVYSSDVGTYLWEQGENGDWTGRSLGPQGIADGTPKPPALLIERHPAVFGPQGRAKARRSADEQLGSTQVPAMIRDDPRMKR